MRQRHHIAFSCLFGFMVFSAVRSPAQNHSWSEIGQPVIRNYAPSEYGAFAQNWSIAQDGRGVMYFANTGGVLEYDGAFWRLIAVPNEVARSVSSDARGHVFVGGVGDLGYLAPDSTGAMQFVSLLDDLPSSNRSFTDIWSIRTTGDSVYFQSLPYVFLFQWSPSSSKPNLKGLWTSPSAFAPSFQVHGDMYFPQQGRGLFRLDRDSMTLVDGGDFFADKNMYVMLPMRGEKILVGTREGLFVYEPGFVRPFPSEAENFFRQHRPTLWGALLKDGTYALGSQSGGVIFMDADGHSRGILNKRSGLRSETIWFMYPDREGNLWLAMDDGIARVGIPSRLSIIDERSGLEGGVVSLYRNGPRLYVSTRTGVYSSFRASVFSKLTGIASQSWSFLHVGDDLLVGTTDGVYVIRRHTTRLVSSGWRFAYTLSRSRRDPNLVYVGLHTGLAMLRFDGTDWIDAGLVPGVTDIVRSMAEDTLGTLWLATPFKGILRLSPAPTPRASRRGPIVHFGPESGLATEQVVLFPHRDAIRFGTANGLRYFDARDSTFKPDSTLGWRYANANYRIKDIAADRTGRVWILGGQSGRAEISRATEDAEGKYHSKVMTDLKALLTQKLEFTNYLLFPDDMEDAVWIFNGECLVRFDTRETAEDTLPGFATLIRCVKVGGDSVMLNGTAAAPAALTLSYSNNSIHVEYAAATFSDEASTQFQVKLEGFDRDWSVWTLETKKEYNNLSPGDFVFRVRARNIHDRFGSEAGLAFSVLPPWYRTFWAYGLFAGLLALLIWESGRIRMRVLQKKTAVLETLVGQRTAQVIEQKDKLEKQAQKLVELDQIKSRFFTNISHEFRTPLTLILGQIDGALSDPTDERRASRLNMAARNARRLQRLINRLLDVARLESGKMKLRASPGPIVEFLRQRLFTFESLAEQKRISLRFDSEETDLILYYDPEKMEDIIDNLIVNALKFTGPGGRVELGAHVRSSSPASDGWLEIVVRDTGIGIPGDRLPHIFDRFYRVDENREQEGSGIGLALVKEMTELHRGQISVRSKEGLGTVFTLQLPLGHAHLSPDEIVMEEEAQRATMYGDTAVLQNEPGMEFPKRTGIKEPEEPASPRPTVLVVEDNADMRTYIGGHLESTYDVVEATDGRQGLAMAIELIPDLIITDVMMPNMDGRELCQHLRSDGRTSHIPVIMLTAKASVESRIEGLETGADDYLVKPFNKKELCVRAANLIHQRERLRRRFREITAIDPAEVSAKPIDQAFMERVLLSIRQHFGDETYGVQTLGDDIGMSVSQLNRKLNALVDQSAGQLIRATRLEYAARLLQQKAGTISEIAYQVGFSDHAGFTRSFKARFGCSPSEYATRSGKTD